MTYQDLYEKAIRLLDNGEITTGEYEEMIKPLKREICEWIPVSERLPEISGLYLVSTDRYGVWATRATMFDVGTNSWAKKGDKRATINAWMPLPDPYREDGEV